MPDAVILHLNRKRPGYVESLSYEESTKTATIKVNSNGIYIHYRVPPRTAEKLKLYFRHGAEAMRYFDVLAIMRMDAVDTSNSDYIPITDLRR